MEPLLPPVFVNEPVTKGTFSPITIFASSLSSVKRFGVDSTLPSPLDCRKRAKAPKTNWPLFLCAKPKFKPEPGVTGVFAASPRAKLMMLGPASVELVPMIPTLFPFVLPKRLCH